MIPEKFGSKTSRCTDKQNDSHMNIKTKKQNKETILTNIVKKKNISE